MTKERFEDFQLDYCHFTGFTADSLKKGESYVRCVRRNLDDIEKRAKKTRANLEKEYLGALHRNSTNGGSNGKG